MNAHTKLIDPIITDAQVEPLASPDVYSGLPHVENPGSIKISAPFNPPADNPTHGGRRAGAGRKPVCVIQARPPGPRWHVLQLTGGHEKRVADDLAAGESRPGRMARRGYQTLLPMTAGLVREHGKRVPGQVPMFYGYAFVRFDASRDDWPALIRCDDVVRVLTTRSMTPIPLPPAFVERLERLVATIAEPVRLGGETMAVRPLGDVLRVVSGAMTGFTGTCVGCDGVNTTIAIQLLGRPVPLTLPYAAFEVAA